MILKQLDFTIEQQSLSFMVDALSEDALSMTYFEVEGTDGKTWNVRLFANDTHIIESKLTILAAAVNKSQIDYTVVPVNTNQDWVSLSQANMKPIEVGPFYVHAPWHNIDNIDQHFHDICINPGQAFGTGSHETTKGCLALLSSLESDVSTILDMGTGTGILALGARYLWQDSNIIAIDNDPLALENATENCIGFDIKLDQAESFTASTITTAAPYDLIIANILAQPLIELSGDINAIIKTGTSIILSGFYDHQKNDVVKAYEQVGFKLQNAITENDWCAVLMIKS